MIPADPDYGEDDDEEEQEDGDLAKGPSERIAQVRLILGCARPYLFTLILCILVVRIMITALCTSATISVSLQLVVYQSQGRMDIRGT